MKTRFEIEKAIIALEELLEKNPQGENIFQNFFEAHDIVFKSLGYKSQLPHPELKDIFNYKILIPDLLLDKYGLLEICDIKLPYEKIIKRKKNRDELYSKIGSDYAAQLREYADYFDEHNHRELITKQYNIPTNKDPKRFLIIGRSSSFKRKELHNVLSSRNYEFDIVTYDDVIDSLKWAHKLASTGFEKAFGVTVSFLFKWIPSSQEDIYLWEFSDDNNSNRFYATISPQKDLRITTESKEFGTYTLHINSQLFANQWRSIIYSHGTSPIGSQIEFFLDCDLIKSEYLTRQITSKRGVNFDKRFIGSNKSGQKGASLAGNYFKMFNHFINFETRRDELRFAINRIRRLLNRSIPILFIKPEGYIKMNYWEGTKSPIGPSLEVFYDFSLPPMQSKEKPIG